MTLASAHGGCSEDRHQFGASRLWGRQHGVENLPQQGVHLSCSAAAGGVWQQRRGHRPLKCPAAFDSLSPLARPPYTPCLRLPTQVLQLTYDFRLEDSPTERARVVAAGATLRRLAATGAGPCGPDEVGHGPLRVWPGGLALSRAIGDADVGPCIVAAPFVKQLRLPPTGGTRIIIASDGVWDAIGNMAAAKPVRKVGVEEAASAVVAAALRLRGLRDDTTVVVVDLCPSSKPLPEFLEEAAAAAKAEQRLAKSNGSAGDLAALEARPSRGGMAALLCGLCGSPAEDDERSARKSVHLPGIEELRELDFHSLMPARRGDVFVLPQIMPRSSGRLSSRSSTNGGMSDPTLAALTGADMPGLYPSAAAAAASSGLASHRAPGGEPQPLTAEGEWLPAEGSNDKASGTAGAAATLSGASGHRGGQRGSTGSSTSDPTEHAGRMYGPGGGDGSGLPPLLRSKYPSSSTNLSGASGAGSVGSDAEGDGSVSKSKGKAAVPLGTVHEQRPAAKGGAGPAAGGSAAAVGPPLTQGAEDASQRIMRLQAEAESRLHGKGGTHHWGDASDRDIEQLRSAHQEAVQMAPPPMAPADASQ